MVNHELDRGIERSEGPVDGASMLGFGIHQHLLG